MSKLTIVTLLLVLLTVLYGCSIGPDYEAIFKENNQTFQQNKTILIHAVDFIKKNKYDTSMVYGYDVDYLDTLPNNWKNDLKNIGIDGMFIHRNTDSLGQSNLSIVFNIGKHWNIESLRVVQIVYAPKNTQTVKGYHKYDGYHIDVWGQGDDFYIWSDTDFI